MYLNSSTGLILEFHADTKKNVFWPFKLIRLPCIPDWRPNLNYMLPRRFSGSIIGTATSCRQLETTWRVRFLIYLPNSMCTLPPMDLLRTGPVILLLLIGAELKNWVAKWWSRIGGKMVVRISPLILTHQWLVIHPTQDLDHCPSYSAHSSSPPVAFQLAQPSYVVACTKWPPIEYFMCPQPFYNNGTVS